MAWLIGPFNSTWRYERIEGKTCAGAIRQIHPFFSRGHMIAVEKGDALLEFGKIVQGMQQALGPVEPLIEHAAWADRIDAEPRHRALVIGIADNTQAAQRLRAAQLPAPQVSPLFLFGSCGVGRQTP
jgi:hypothetical protein